MFRPRTALGIKNGIIPMQDKWTQQPTLLRRVELKYLEKDQVFQILLNLHLRSEVSCVVFDNIESLISDGRETEAICLAFNSPKIQMVIVTKETKTSIHTPFLIRGLRLDI